MVSNTSCSRAKCLHAAVLSSVLIVALGFFAGCASVGPDYVQPATELPDAWTQAVQQGFGVDALPAEGWWTTFSDPVLDDLIAQAESGNYDLKAVIARIDEARSLRGISRSEFWPTIDGGGRAEVNRISEEIQPDLGDARSRSDTIFAVGVGMAWELDFWGRVRRSVESADASLARTIEDYRDALLLLRSDMAGTYIQLRGLQERIRLAQANVKRQEQTLALVEQRNEAGLVPVLDVRQAELNLASTRSRIPTLRAQRGIALHRLSVLAGKSPNALRTLLEGTSPIPSPSPSILVGTPADVVRRRPDIRAAERAVAAQSARIGVATADLYPTFTLPGAIALEAYDASSLGNGLAYSFAPTFRWNLFSGGRIRQQIQAEEARTEQALNIYQQTVLRALGEVEDAMVSYAEERDRRALLGAAVKAALESVTLVQELYRQGLTNFQNVLDMERSLSAQEDNMAESSTLLAADAVLIFKALGGGSLPEAAAAAPADE